MITRYTLTLHYHEAFLQTLTHIQTRLNNLDFNNRGRQRQNKTIEQYERLHSGVRHDGHAIYLALSDEFKEAANKALRKSIEIEDPIVSELRQGGEMARRHIDDYVNAHPRQRALSVAERAGHEGAWKSFKNMANDYEKNFDAATWPAIDAGEDVRRATSFGRIRRNLNRCVLSYVLSNTRR